MFQRKINFVLLDVYLQQCIRWRYPFTSGSVVFAHNARVGKSRGAFRRYTQYAHSSYPHHPYIQKKKIFLAIALHYFWIRFWQQPNRMHEHYRLVSVHRFVVMARLLINFNGKCFIKKVGGKRVHRAYIPLSFRDAFIQMPNTKRME